MVVRHSAVWLYGAPRWNLKLVKLINKPINLNRNIFQLNKRFSGKLFVNRVNGFSRSINRLRFSIFTAPTNLYMRRSHFWKIPKIFVLISYVRMCFILNISLPSIFFCKFGGGFQIYFWKFGKNLNAFR